jgi:hypothetical protein
VGHNERPATDSHFQDTVIVGISQRGTQPPHGRNQVALAEDLGDAEDFG